MVLIKVTIVLQCTRDIVIKGTIQRDFWFLVLFVNEPIWTTDQRVKYFKILVKIVPSYSNFKLEKNDSPGFATPGRLLKNTVYFKKLIPITCVKVIRANYGRFSVAICNEGGNTDWSVNCMSPRSLRIVQDR